VKQSLLHIVGGGKGQLSLVKKAQSMGLSVLVTDMYADPPCKPLADKFLQINTQDREGTLQAAVRYGVDAVATDQTDVAVSTVAYVAERLSLPGIGLETALRFTNKRTMRERLAAACPSNVPRFAGFTDKAACCEYIAGCHGDVIIKPADSQGSRGVHRVAAEAQIEALVTDAFRGGFGGGVLVETFVQGDEVAVESVVVDDEPRLLAISAKEHYPENDALDWRVSFPAALTDRQRHLLVDLNRNIVRHMGLRNGLTHGEYKIDGEQVWIIEIAARGAGSGVSSHIVPFLTGFDTGRAIIDFAFGRRPALNIADNGTRVAVLEFLRANCGTISKIEIARKARDAAALLEIELKLGDTVGRVHDSRDRAGYFIVCAENAADLDRKMETVRSGITLESQ